MKYIVHFPHGKSITLESGDMPAFRHGDPKAPAKPTRIAQIAKAAEERRRMYDLHREELCGDEALPPGVRCTVSHLNSKTCRWPIGDVGHPDFHFCGAEPEAGESYCAKHCRVAYPAGVKR